MTHRRPAFAGSTDLPVVLPVRMPDRGRVDWRSQLTSPWAGLSLALLLAASIVLTEARAQAGGQTAPGVLDVLVKWTPLLFWGPPGEFGGFTLNILVSFAAMALGTALGLWLGLALLSRFASVRRAAWVVTQIFRNSPWLVLLFYFMLLLPFSVTIFDQRIDIPGWVKATFALSLPIMANIAEVVRGAVNSIPTGQWESAESLAFSRRQTLWMIILPQCLKRMTPPWMNWYQILTMATPLISILGVNDVMRLTRDALAAEGRAEYLIPMFLWIMSWFFIYCYPIARWTMHLERKWTVDA